MRLFSILGACATKQALKNTNWNGTNRKKNGTENASKINLDFSGILSKFFTKNGLFLARGWRRMKRKKSGSKYRRIQQISQAPVFQPFG
ncbi:MAG: hypothetical protein MJZ54_00200 [Bacteroidaceae bacterium]|nr:hypothetical protein [Bacteroidaceae bacterium]